MSLKVMVMLDELKDLIIHNLDVMEFLDILGVELADVIDKFDEEIEEYKEALLKAVQ
jgi:hypothetical protein